MSVDFLPFRFDVRDGELPATVLIDPAQPARALDIIITNQTEQTVHIPASDATPNGHVFAIHFEPGVITSEALDSVPGSDGWDVARGTTGVWSSFHFGCSRGRSLAPRETLQLRLTGIRPDASRGTAWARVVLSHQQLSLGTSTSHFQGSASAQVRVEHVASSLDPAWAEFESVEPYVDIDVYRDKYGDPRVARDHHGVVRLTGLLVVKLPKGPIWRPLFTLPESFRPSHAMKFVAWENTRNETCCLHIAATGGVFMYGPAGTRHVSLSNVSFIVPRG